MSQWELIVAALALLAGVWSHVKSVAHWLRGFVVATRWMEDDGAATVASYLTRDRRHSAREPVYNMASMHVRPLGRSCWIAYELLSAGGLFWHGRVPIWLREQDKGGRGGPAFKYSFSCVRGTVDWDELVTAAGSWRSDVSRGTGWKTVRHQVHYHHGTSMAAEIDRKNDGPTKTHHSWNRGCGHRLVHWRPEDVGSKNRDGFSTVVLDRSQTALVEEIRRWLDTREWYEERGIPWRKGLLFDGEPGTGKTTFIRSCAQDMDLSVHLFDLATMSNEELRKAWNEMAQDAPCVAVIEDIDRVFRGDVNITPPSGAMTSGGLTFNALLNCVDGVERCEGVLFVVTTNHIEHVDPALADRPGRIDRVIKFGALDLDMRMRIARRIVGDGPRAAQIATESPDVVAAKFVEVCCREALREHYAESNPYRAEAS